MPYDHTVNQKMVELCKILKLPPKVTSLQIYYDFNGGILHCQCECIKNEADELGDLVRVFHSGKITWDEENNDG